MCLCFANSGSISDGKDITEDSDGVSEAEEEVLRQDLWTMGDFVWTTGNVTDGLIKAYIKQPGKDDGYGNFQAQH